MYAGGWQYSMIGINAHGQTITLPVFVQVAGGGGHNHHHALPLHDEYDDDFLMYTYKVRRCAKTRSHDWTECPYAHRGEKARRRDPRKFPYNGISCPEFRQTGDCRRGQNCEFAHGVFEFWLHPSRYRTRSCESGSLCPRRICFFAHAPEQLRPEVVHDCYRCGPYAHTVNTGRAHRLLDPHASTSFCSPQPVVAGWYHRAGAGAGAGAAVAVAQAQAQEEYSFDEPDIGWVLDLVD